MATELLSVYASPLTFDPQKVPADSPSRLLQMPPWLPIHPVLSFPLGETAWHWSLEVVSRRSNQSPADKNIETACEGQTIILVLSIKLPLLLLRELVIPYVNTKLIHDIVRVYQHESKIPIHIATLLTHNHMPTCVQCYMYTHTYLVNSLVSSL